MGLIWQIVSHLDLWHGGSQKRRVLFCFGLCFFLAGRWFILRMAIRCGRQYFCFEKCGILRLLNFEPANVSAVVVM